MEHIEYNGFTIDKTKTGYRVTRIGTDQHSHLSNLNPCYRLIDNVNRHRIPTRCSGYYIESHIRLSNDENYTRRLTEYLEVKNNKTKQHYFNPHRKRF